MTEISWHTGKTVKQLAGERDIDHTSLAGRLGISRASIYNFYEKAEWRPHHLNRAAALFGVRWAWLQSGEGEKLASSDIYSVTNPKIERTLMLYLDEHKSNMISLLQAIARIIEEDSAALASAGKSPQPAYRGTDKKAPAKKARAAKKRGRPTR